MSTYSDLLDLHIKYVENVNNALTREEENKHANILYGFRRALEILNINQLSDCDLYYINKGIDRPMCCGIFLDKNLEK